MNVKEIEKAIEKLPRHEMVALASWWEKHHHDLWDKQIEDDLDSGRLDAVLSQAEEDYQAGLARPL